MVAIFLNISDKHDNSTAKCCVLWIIFFMGRVLIVLTLKIIAYVCTKFI